MFWTHNNFPRTVLFIFLWKKWVNIQTKNGHASFRYPDGLGQPQIPEEGTNARDSEVKEEMLERSMQKAGARITDAKQLRGPTTPYKIGPEKELRTLNIFFPNGKGTKYL